MNLNSLLAPISPSEFFAKYWEQRPLHTKRACSGYFKNVLSLGELDSHLRNNDNVYPWIRLVKDGIAVPTSEYTRNSRHLGGEVLTVNPDRLYDQLSKGATVILDGLHRNLRGLAELTQSLELDLAIPVQTNVYLTPPSSQGFSPHWDTHDVLILQVNGSKRWKLYDTPLHLPTENQPFKKVSWQNCSPTMEFDLEDGDLLYIPRGLVHSAQSNQGYSVHVTVGLMTPTQSSLIRTLIGLVEKEVDFRAGVPAHMLSTVSERKAYYKEFCDRFCTFLHKLDPEALFASRDTAFVAKRFPESAGRLLDLQSLGSISEQSLLSIRSGVHWRLAFSSDSVNLSFNGKEVRLPLLTKAVIASIVEAKEFVPANLPDDLDLPGKMVLVKRLVREGFLRIVALRGE